MWLCSPLGWTHGELPSWHQELTSLGAARVAAVPLCDLGLSHAMGICSQIRDLQSRAVDMEGKDTS